jgi:PAS domain S-box-containing protein
MLDKLGSQARLERPVVEMNPWLGRVGLFIAVGVGYFLAAQLGLALLTTAERVAVFWPASGIAVGILLALGPWACWPVAAGVIAATLAANLIGDRTVWSALAFGLCNAGEALLAMWLIERWFGPAFNLDTLRRVVGFFAAAAIATAVAALGAAGAMKLFGPSTAQFLDVWQVWFRSDALGLVTVAPLLVGVAASVRDAPSWRELLEGTLAVVAVAVVNGLALGLLAGPWSLMAPAVFLFPLLLWIGSRCRPAFAAAAAFSVAAAIVWTTIHGFGRYGDPNPAIADRVLAAQVTMLGITLAALAVAALFAERRKAELALAEREAQLGLAGKAARVGSFVIDYATERIHTSPGFAAAHGLAEETEGLTCEEWRAHLLPDDRARFEALRSEVFAEQRRELNMEYRIVGADGEARWIESRGLVSYDSDGRPMRLVGVHIDITERKQAEQVLAERNAQLGFAGKFALVGTYRYDVGTEKYEVSPGYAAIHGLPEGTEETTRAEWRTRVHPNDLTAVEAGFEQAMAERRCEYYCEYRFSRPDGEMRWIDSRNFISYADGLAPRVVGANIDVTQRKVAEAALEEHKASLADALVAGRVVAFEWEAVTHQTRRSDNAASTLGHDEGGLTAPLRNDFLRRVHPDDRELFRSKIRGLSPSSPSYVLNFRFFRRDGRQVWLEETATGAFDGTGRLSRIKGLTRDITEGKEAELALAERTVQLALAGKAALVGAYAYDTETEMMQISEGYVAIHGFPEGTTEIARSACLAGVHPDDIERVQQSRSEAFRARRREYSVEYRIIHPGGEMRWVETRCFITYDIEGCRHRVVGVSIDVTERKRVEEQQSKLVAELDHRVKNVLATVQAVAAHTMQTSRSMEDFVAALDGRIRSMGSTHELLSHRRWAGIPLADLVKRELAPYTTGPNTEVGGPDVTLSAEAGQTMGMVLHELVTNAAKHGSLSDPAGRVSIRWRLSLNGGACDRLIVTWRETGGPLVVPPCKSRYGMDVVRSVIPYELGGTVDHVLAPEGARCQIEIPLTLPSSGSTGSKASASAYSFRTSDDIEGGG